MRRRYIGKMIFAFLVATLIPFSTYAWFTNTIAIVDDNDKELETKLMYYGGGNGSEENPFIISEARHLYNLAWLQDLGFYDGDNKKYFKLTNSIDMSVIGAIPPIGIDEHPFVSTLIGDGNIITNLTIDTSMREFINRPSNYILQKHLNDTISSVTDEGYIRTSYIGMFGRIDTKDDSNTENIKEGVTNFIIDNSDIRLRNPNKKVGIIAGFVDGNLSKIGASRSSIKIIGTTFAPEIVSKYTLIGDYKYNYETGEGDVEWIDKPGQQGIGFGGSIDLMTTCRRINYMCSKMDYNTLGFSGSYDSSTSKTPTNDYNIVFRTHSQNSGYTFNWRDCRNNYYYGDLLTNSYMPINVDLDAMGINPDDNEVIEIDYEDESNRNINSYYANNNNEIISNTNTGYLVGYSVNTGSYSGLRFRFQGLDYNGSSNEHIRPSLGNESSFINEKFQLISSLNNNNDFKTIKDSYNATFIENNGPTTGFEASTANDLKLEKYDSVRNNISEMFKNNILYGMRFTYNICGTNDINLSQVQINNCTFTASPSDKILINNKTYDNYDFISGGLNFTVAKKGIITYVIGAYGNSDYYAPSLFSVERNSITNKISSITKIKKISDNNGNLEYNSNSLSNVVYIDRGNTKYPQENVLYYCEIPVNPGDYYLGAGVNNPTNHMPYFMYLDIGANGESEAITAQNTISEIDFVKINTNIIPFSESYSFTEVLFEIKAKESDINVSLYFVREDDNTTLPIVSYNEGNNIDIIPIGELASASIRTP